MYILVMLTNGGVNMKFERPHLLSERVREFRKFKEGACVVYAALAKFP